MQLSFGNKNQQQTRKASKTLSSCSSSSTLSKDLVCNNCVNRRIIGPDQQLKRDFDREKSDKFTERLFNRNPDEERNDNNQRQENLKRKINAPPPFDIEKFRSKNEIEKIRLQNPQNNFDDISNNTRENLLQKAKIEVQDTWKNQINEKNINRERDLNNKYKTENTGLVYEMEKPERVGATKFNYNSENYKDQLREQMAMNRMYKKEVIYKLFKGNFFFIL